VNSFNIQLTKMITDADGDSGALACSDRSKKKRRWGAKSRWGNTDETEKEIILGSLPTVIPAGLTKEQEEQYLRAFLYL
jgi:hypothetical protein